MSLNVQLEQQLHAVTSAMIEIPDINSWDDVEDWYIRLDILWYVLKADPNKWLELSLDSETMDIVDWGEPIGAEVYKLDEDGDQTGEVLDEK